MTRPHIHKIKGSTVDSGIDGQSKLISISIRFKHAQITCIGFLHMFMYTLMQSKGEIKC